MDSENGKRKGKAKAKEKKKKGKKNASSSASSSEESGETSSGGKRILAFDTLVIQTSQIIPFIFPFKI